MTVVVAKNKVVSLIYAVRNEKGEIFEYRDLPVKDIRDATSEEIHNGRPASDLPTLQ